MRCIKPDLPLVTCVEPHGGACNSTDLFVHTLPLRLVHRHNGCIFIAFLSAILNFKELICFGDLPALADSESARKRLWAHNHGSHPNYVPANALA
jgi:hypothetical protein